jgi:EmrB/QacA subfamily drug resistance transporter
MTQSTTAPRLQRKAILALLLIAGAQLMIVLDITIVNVALPSIARGLHFSPTSLAWVVDAYTLVFGGLLLLGGRSGDIFGRRRMFIIGVLLFAFSSLVAGLATSEGLLIAARALQGVGGAIASPTALALIASNFTDPKERAEALGIFAAVSAVGASLGLLAGGLLTQYLDWRWVFFVNAPIAVVIAIAAPRVLRESERQPVNSDLTGSIASVAGIGLLVYGLIHAASAGWTSTVTVLSFVGAAVGIAGFIIRERLASDPLLNLDILKHRVRVGAYLIMLAIAAALFSLWFFLTQFVQNVLAYSPLKAGLAFLPMTATVMIIAKNGSKVLRRTGPMPMLTYGTLAVAAALYWLSHLTVGAGYLTQILPPLLLNATGLGMVFSAVFPTAMSEVTPVQAGLGSALVSVAQQVGGTLGISILVTVATALTTAKAHALAHAPGHHTHAAASTLATVHGWDGGFEVASIMALLGALVAITMLRGSKAHFVTKSA